MFIKISSGKNVKVIEISKKEQVIEIKKQIEKDWNIKIEKQKLFFSGKVLNDNTPIYKYDVKEGYVIQLIQLEKPVEPAGEKPVKEKTKVEIIESQLSEYYKLGEAVEVQDPEDGSWYEAQIIEISQEGNKENSDDNAQLQPVSVYKVSYEKDGTAIEKELKLEEFRPRSIHPYDVGKLKIRQTIHINYNLKQPQAWGKWYDFYVEEICRKKNVSVIGNVLMGKDKERKDVKLDLSNFEGSVFVIREHVKVSERGKDYDAGAKPIFCDNCRRNRGMKCRDCGCCVCGRRADPDKTIVCDECNRGFHIYCLRPALKDVPEEDEWYCKECKNEDEIVKAGETVKTKRGHTADKSKSTRDWGRGMATAGRSTINTIVGETHFGSIPGVEVGTTWRYRIQVSEAGVHRPHVAGIAGRQDVGAFSIVLAGGYEDDQDDGDEVLYTGSGGRDLSGNKRVSGQSCDQELTRMNRALARNCNAPINVDTGSESNDWTKGKPVRVVRSYKEKSPYAPAEGFRYDGLYKIVKYFPKTGKSGFKVWQFLLRRDDPTPAPWTKAGRKHIESLGLEDVIYPENYAEKNKRGDSDDGESEGGPRKKAKIKAFELCELQADVDADELNAGKWSELSEKQPEGKVKYLEAVQSAFQCICCQDLIHKPVTTPCRHNFCQSCFRNAQKVMGKVCPLCKTDLVEAPAVNAHLEKVLVGLFPGYEVGR